ncbi:hypothetical protein K503DRAFT_401208 [Rhizopogon vinicolor AM-OR11-026]|uniref:Uncharacterized protein n=1 Tax=Rhizopogon vinicolor AM-OR11-026 TaxID=1314800 RepID=A0A1B7NBG5_9AGAM|nr:hypothetical protein K503DRAFT_401208 [Rhizopogon vinicolor AM-OR11-026]
MHPIKCGCSDKPRPAIVAFNVNTEHKVMPVNKDVRLVLQYDVEAVGEEALTPPWIDIKTYPNSANTLIRQSSMKSKNCTRNGQTHLLQRSSTSTAERASRADISGNDPAHSLPATTLTFPKFRRCYSYLL